MLNQSFEKNKGIYFILFAVLCFAIMNALVKTLDRIPSHELILFRSIVSLSVCSWFIAKNRIPFFGNNKLWLAIRGFFGFCALITFFLTLKHVPLATTSTLQYLSIFFTVFVAMLLNDQRVKHVQWLFFLISFAGIVLMKGFDSRISTQWMIVGIISAAFAGITYNAVIKSKGTDHPITIVLYSPLVCIPITGVWCLFDWVKPEGVEWLLLLLIGIAAQSGQYFTTLALHSDDASRVTPWNYFGAVFALIIGYLFFDERFSAMGILGMLLIVTGVVLNASLKKTEVSKT